MGGQPTPPFVVFLLLFLHSNKCKENSPCDIIAGLQCTWGTEISSLPHEQPGLILSPVVCILGHSQPGPFHEASPGSLPDAFSPQGAYPCFCLMGRHPRILCPAMLPNCLSKPHSKSGPSGAVVPTMPPDPTPCLPPSSCHPSLRPTYSSPEWGMEEAL